MEENTPAIFISLVGNYSGAVPEKTLLVETDHDYLDATLTIREFLSQPDNELKIWARKKVHFNWLKVYLEMVSVPAQFAEKTPKLILAETWQVFVPDWLRDDQVLDQKLLEIKVPNHHPTTFVDTLLLVLLGEQFTGEYLREEDLPSLVSMAMPEKQSVLEQYPIGLQCLERKCRQWIENAADSWVEQVCARLPKESDSLWHDLTIWLLLHGYPEQYLDYELPPHRKALVQQIGPEKLAGMELHRVAESEAAHQVEVFFNDIERQVKSSDDFTKIIRCCSGRIAAEFTRLQNIIRRLPNLVRANQLEEIRQKFSSCPGISTTDLLRLDTMIAPTRPSCAGDEELWDAAQWIRWTRNEYIPYRHWQTENNRADAGLEQTVARFSDWYMKNYSALHQEVSHSLVHLLTSWDSAIRQEDLSLFLVIDCLPLTYFPLLAKAFRVEGFYRHEQGVRFAPLPSSTEPRKRLLLSGDPQVDIQAGYEKILAQRVEKSWPRKKAYYFSDLQAMRGANLGDGESTVCALNYVPSDEIMHGDPASKGMTYEEELFNCFTKLAKSVHSFLQQNKKDNAKTGIYVVTDHGATRILDSERKNLESTVVQDLFKNTRHRFARIDAELADTIPDNLWEMGYRFKPPFSDADFVYFIPRGHKTAGTKTGARGYVHGGATPEEVIVPVAVFKLEERGWQDPQGRFINLRLDPHTQAATFHIQRVVGLELAVRNPNPEEIKIVRVEVARPEMAEIREFTPCVVMAGSEQQFKIRCYFNKNVINENELLLRFIYQFGEEERGVTLSSKAVFKTAMTGGFSLKDL